MSIPEAETAIRGAGIISECLLVFAWAVRGRRKPFWIVGGYAIYHLLFSTGALLFHVRIHDLGNAFYMLDYALDFALLSGIIIESFVYIARPLTLWPSGTRFLFVSASFIGILIPALLVISLNVRGVKRDQLWDDRLDLFTSLLLCTFLLMTAWINTELGDKKSIGADALRWGLVTWTGTTLVINLCHIQQRWTVSPVYDLISNTCWVIMMFSWALTVWGSGRTEENANSSQRPAPAL